MRRLAIARGFCALLVAAIGNSGQEMKPKEEAMGGGGLLEDSGDRPNAAGEAECRAASKITEFCQANGLRLEACAVAVKESGACQASAKRNVGEGFGSRRRPSAAAAPRSGERVAAQALAVAGDCRKALSAAEALQTAESFLSHNATHACNETVASVVIDSKCVTSTAGVSGSRSTASDAFMRRRTGSCSTWATDVYVDVNDLRALNNGRCPRSEGRQPALLAQTTKCGGFNTGGTDVSKSLCRSCGPGLAYALRFPKSRTGTCVPYNSEPLLKCVNLKSGKCGKTENQYDKTRKSNKKDDRLCTKVAVAKQQFRVDRLTDKAKKWFNKAKGWNGYALAHCNLRKEVACISGGEPTKAYCAVKKQAQCLKVCKMKRKGDKDGHRCSQALCMSDQNKGQYGDLPCRDAIMTL